MTKPNKNDPWKAEAIFNDDFLCFHLEAPVSLSIQEMESIIDCFQNILSKSSVYFLREKARFTKYTDGKYKGTWYMTVPISNDISKIILEKFKCTPEGAIFRIIDKLSINHD